MAYGTDGYDVLAYMRSNVGLNVVLMVPSLVTFIFFMHVQQAPAKFAWSYFGFIIVSSGAYFLAVLLELIRMGVSLNPDDSSPDGWQVGVSVVNNLAVLLLGIAFVTLFLGFMGLTSSSINGKQQRAGVIRAVGYLAAAVVLLLQFVVFGLQVATVVVSINASHYDGDYDPSEDHYENARKLAEASNKTAWATELLVLLTSIFALGRGIQAHFSDKIENKFTSRLLLITSILLVVFGGYNFGFLAYFINPATGRLNNDDYSIGPELISYVLDVILSELPLFICLWAIYYAGKGAYKTEHVPKAPRNVAPVEAEKTKADDAASSTPATVDQV